MSEAKTKIVSFNQNLFSTEDRELLIHNWRELEALTYPDSIYGGTPPEEMTTGELLKEINLMLAVRLNKEENFNDV